VSATTEFHKTEVETLYKSKYKSVFSKHSKLPNQSIEPKHAKKVTELVTGRKDQLDLEPVNMYGGDLPFQIEAGASRTEA
jgi:hypothetical protein